MMKLYYKIVCLATSALFIFLSFQLLFMAESFVGGLGLQPSEATAVLARRTAMFMLGIAVLMFASRNLPPSNARQYICMATGITFFGLSCMGSYEYIRGTVNASIFVAIIIETISWISFAIIIFKKQTT